MVEEASAYIKVKTEMDATLTTNPNRDDNRFKWAMNVMTNKAIRQLSREFINNKKIKPTEYTTEAYEKHDAKNRYNDILCMDSTRVILRDRPGEDDYIHASWMIMPNQQKYICTQGPLQETVEDFWHMIFQEKSNVIVMLCNFNEGKHEKCRQYYPKVKNGMEQYGAYKITIKETKPDLMETIKYQILEAECRGKTLLIHHLACLSWPDHTAPLNPAPTVGMFKMAKVKAAGMPITVHCSAGIGRTATFVGIDYAAQRIREDCGISMVEVLKELRNQRFHAIQSPIQYIFLHICLLELFADENIIPRKGKLAAYTEAYTTMLKKYNKKVAAAENKAAKMDKEI